MGPSALRVQYMVETYADRDVILEEMGYESYRMYLASKLWSAIRKRCLVAHDYTCVLCGLHTYTVHHHQYTQAVLEGRDLSQLFPLCKDCHRKVEVYRDGSKRCLSKAQERFTELMSRKPIVEKRRRECRGCGNKLFSKQPLCATCKREVRKC